jgi:hypothetical protein
MRRSLAVTALALILAATAAQARAGDPVAAARVNGVAIERERLERYFEDFLSESGRSVAAIRSPAAYAALHRQALEALVDAELLWQEAQRRGRLAPAAEVDAAVVEVRTFFPRPGELERRLERGAFTLASYREYLRRQLSIRRLVQEEVVRGIGTTAAEAEAERQAWPAQYAHLDDAGALAAAGRAVQDRKERAALEALVKRLRAGATIELADAR